MGFSFDRQVRFDDIDAAGIVFFGRFLTYCHDAMERFFDALDGGYVALITQRQIGLPAVHVACDFRAPLRYGDVARIAVSVLKIGTTSCTFRYDITRGRDGASVATVEHVVVSSDLTEMKKLPFPADVRALLEAHRTPE